MTFLIIEIQPVRMYVYIPPVTQEDNAWSRESNLQYPPILDKVSKQCCQDVASRKEELTHHSSIQPFARANHLHGCSIYMERVKVKAYSY
jgi:hypothetical protein